MNIDPNKKVNIKLMEHLEHRIANIKYKIIPMTDEELSISILLDILHHLLCCGGYFNQYHILNLFIVIHHYLLNINSLDEIKNEIKFCMELIEQNQR